MRVLSQKFCDQRFFFFQFVDACVDFLAAEVIQRHLVNDLPVMTSTADRERIAAILVSEADPRT